MIDASTLRADRRPRRAVAIALTALLACVTARAQCEVQELHGLEDATPLGGFGYSVALSGETAFVGWWHDENNTNGTGSVYVFERDATGWKRQHRFYPGPGQIHFATVAVAGDVAAACGWRKAAMAGKAYFYERGVSGWQQVGTAKPADLEFDDEYGASIAIDGDTVLVGSPKDDDACPTAPQCNSGSVYVYERGPNGWNQQQKLVASDAGPDQYFGASVAIEGNRAVVGSYSVYAPWNGAAYVFERQGGTWVETARVTASDDTAAMWYGLRIALSGDRFVTSAMQVDDGRGAAYLYELIGGSWIETRLTASDGVALDGFGSGLDIDGDRLLIGARGDKDAGTHSGSAYLFENRNGSWEQASKLRAPNAQALDWFGWAVALEDDTAMIASPVVLWDVDDRYGSVHMFDLAENTTQYCYGSGCPCGNDDSVEGCVNSTGRGALLAACGSTSVGSDDLILEATSLPLHAPTLVSMGAGRSHSLLGDGRRCIAGRGLGVFTYPALGAGDTGTVRLGPGIVDASQIFGLPGSIATGQTWNFQAFYRDADGACATGMNSTNAVSVIFGP